jgi:hypothetical protein
MASNEQGAERTGHCYCGSLTVTARGEPVDVYACSCSDCPSGAAAVHFPTRLFIPSPR